MIHRRQKNVSSILFEESTRGERIKRKPVVVRSVRAQVLKKPLSSKEASFRISVTSRDNDNLIDFYFFERHSTIFSPTVVFSVYQVEASSSQMAKK